MQKDETASCQGSVLNLGSVALSEVTQSMTDYVPSSQNAAVTNSSAFYDGLNYPSISAAMKRDALTGVQSSRDGNRGYMPQIGYSGANAAVGREAYCNELFYSEDKAYAEGVDLSAPVLHGQDQMQPGKVLYTSSGRVLEGDVLEQNSNYFNVPLSDLQLAIVSSKAMRNGQVAPNEKVAFVKERKTEGILKESRDAKPIRILQRPSVHATGHSEKRSDEEEVKMLDALTLMPQKRIHHRKKTLSLNPEEREALESLVEEVIIGGFEEDIASSDETVSEDEDLNISKAVVERKRNMKDLKDRGDVGVRYADQIVLEKGTKLLQQRDALDRKRNNFQKDFNMKPMSKYGRKDQRKVKENDHYSTKVKTDHRTIDSSLQQNKTVMLNSDKEKTDDRVQGLNIYPAQLKVAIKHMDSLPPRFLRRLQSGQNRLDLILPRHSEMASDDRGEPAAAESDKGRSKVLRETKKSIRNLLCDLDQYVDEGLTMPVMNESLSNLPFSLNPCDKSLDNGAFQSEGFSGVLKHSSPPDRMKPLTYLNHQPFASRLFPMPMDASGVLQVPHCIGTSAVDAPYLGEKTGIRSKGIVYQCEEVEKLLKSGSDIAPHGVKALYDNGAEKKDFMQQNVEHFPGNGEGFDLCRQPSNAPISMKKSQFSVDAPEFVSAFFKTNRTSDAGSVFQPGLFNPLQHGNGSGLSQPGVQVPVYVASEVEGIAQQDGLAREVLPGTPSSEEMSRVKYLGMPGLPEPLASFQAVPFVPASTLASSAYLDRAPPSELFASHVPCPHPPPPHPSHAVIGMMHYQPYQFSPCVSGFGPPEFALDRQNFLIPAAPPSWMNEMQPPNGLPVTAMGWCPPGQAPFVSCSLGQQLPEKVPMLLCNPGPFMQDSSYAAWNWQNTCTDPDTLYQRVTDLLNNGEFVLVILIGAATSDLSTITSQWQGITDDVVFMSTDGSILDTNNSPVLNSESADSSSLAVPYSGPEKHDVVTLSNCSSTDMEIKLKQVFQGKRRLIILDHTYAAQPWEIHNYVALAQGLGYQVEVVDLSENGPYPGPEATGSFMFEGDYHSSLMYPPSAPNSEFMPGATLPLYQHLKV